MAPKFTIYELKLEGDADTIAFLKPRLPASYATIAEANRERAAIDALLAAEMEKLTGDDD